MEFSKENFDAIIIGSGIGGLVTASQLAAKGARILVLEKYIIPGGSGGSFKRKGYIFDVGASMIFGFGEKGYTNLEPPAPGPKKHILVHIRNELFDIPLREGFFQRV